MGSKRLRSGRDKQTRKDLIGPSGEKLNCLGFLNTTLSWNGKKIQQIIYVCKNLQKALLRKPAIREMNIISFNKPKNLSCNTADTKEENGFIKEFPDVFTGLGHHFISVHQDKLLYQC